MLVDVEMMGKRTIQEWAPGVGGGRWSLGASVSEGKDSCYERTDEEQSMDVVGRLWV